MFIYFWERESGTEVWVGESQKEGDTESEVGSTLWAIRTEPDMGLEFMDLEIMTWAEVGRPTDWATQVPHVSWFSLEEFLLIVLCPPLVSVGHMLQIKQNK